MKLFGRMLALTGPILLRKSWTRVYQLSCILHRVYQRNLQTCISRELLSALVAGEDHRFHRHGGIDLIAIGGAMVRALQSGKLSGASTIEQQLVRVLTGDRRRSVARKFREIMLACCLSSKFPKHAIAGMYLSVAYFGWRMNGVQQACEHLGINIRRATRRQAAALIARLKYPEPQRASSKRRALLTRRADHILVLMSKNAMASRMEVATDAALLDP